MSPIGDDSRLRRIAKVACWILGAAAVLVLLDRFGVDIGGWLAEMWKHTWFGPSRLPDRGPRAPVASGTAVTPGGAGLNEAMSVVALAHYTDAQTATAFAVGQHFFGTASSILLAMILVPAVFGWKDGEALLKSASAQAKKRRAAAKSASQTA